MKRSPNRFAPLRAGQSSRPSNGADGRTATARDSLSPEAITSLLHPFVAQPLSVEQLAAISVYLDLLLRWNARLNLTSVRDANNIVTRHIGESWFAAEQLFPVPDTWGRAIDLGSGAGFPGLPLKLYAPGLDLTLVESQQKKAIFLKEAVRALSLSGVSVFSGRAEVFPGRADLVTLRAVERFEQVLPVAASLLAGTDHSASQPARLALLIGASQVPVASKLLPDFRWNEPIPIPQSVQRVLLVGEVCK